MEIFKINAPHIVHEIFEDDEAAVINLITGNYYTLNLSGSKIWDGFEKNLSNRRIIAELESFYDAEPALIAESFANFTNELKAEGLISPDTVNSTSEENLQMVTPPAKEAFVVPQLERFGDAQELLLLDPIHDVAEMGFPHRRDETGV